MGAPARRLLPRQLLPALLLAGAWQAAVSQEPFHCDVALNNYVKAWSRTKKEWCCKEMNAGCEGGTNFTTAAAAPSTTLKPQVDRGNTLAMAPIADWPSVPEQGEFDEKKEDEKEAEEQFKPCEDIASGGIFWAPVRRATGLACWEICQEEQLRVRIAPWLALGLLVVLDLVAIWQAISGCRSKATQDSWAVGLQLANRLFLEAPLCAAAALWLILAGPSLLILDSERPAVCFKALGAALVGLPSLEQVGVPVEIAEQYQVYEIYASCAIGLLCGFVRFVWAEAAGGGICCWCCGCCCCCCCRRQQPDDYTHRRPLEGCPKPLDDAKGRLLCCEVSEQTEAQGLVNRARMSLQFGSLLGVALAIDLACSGQIFMTLAAFCGIAVGVRESAHALKLNRGVVDGRPRDIYCPWGSDTAMLCKMSYEMGWSTSELLEKYGLQGATESCIYLYITLVLLVAGELPDHADLVLTLLVSLISLYAMLQGVGRGAELCSAERERLATTQGLPLAQSAHRNNEHHHDSHRHQHHRGMQEHTASRESTSSSLNSSRNKVQYRGCLIQFQDYNGRKALERLRLRFAAPYRACEALPVAVGLALWCKGGMLILGYAVGGIFAVSWEVLHPRERPSGGGWLASLAPRVLEPLLWPAYGTFAPLHLADPTRDHSEKHHRVDHLVFPAWLGVRSLYILILWSIALTSPDCMPLLPAFFSVQDLKDPTQVQRLIAWCWVVSGCVAAGLFPLLGLYMHSKRQFWVDEDWKRLMQHETHNDSYEIASDIHSVPVLYKEWSDQEKSLDHGHVEDTPLDKLAALNFFGFWQDVRSGKVYEESGLPDVVHLFTDLFSHRQRRQSKRRVNPADHRHVDRMDRLDPRARDPYPMHQYGDPMERGSGGYRQVPTRDDRRDERYWQTQLPGDMAKPGTRTEPATRGGRGEGTEGYNELPHLIPHEVKKDSEFRLQVRMDDLLDPLMNSLDVFFASEFLKYLNARIDHEGGHALVVSKIFKDAVGEEARQDQVMVKKITGRPGVLGVLAADSGGGAGSDFGELARTRNGDWLLMHGGLPVVVFELGDLKARNFTAFPVLARGGNVTLDRKRYLAQAGCGLHGLGHNWNFRAVPGTDAVLLISCMLALALLIHESELGRNHY